MAQHHELNVPEPTIPQSIPPLHDIANTLKQKNITSCLDRQLRATSSGHFTTRLLTHSVSGFSRATPPAEKNLALLSTSIRSVVDLRAVTTRTRHHALFFQHCIALRTVMRETPVN